MPAYGGAIVGAMGGTDGGGPTTPPQGEARRTDFSRPASQVPEQDVGAWPFPLGGIDEAEETASSREHAVGHLGEGPDSALARVGDGGPNKLDPLLANKAAFNETDTDIDAGDAECRRDSEVRVLGVSCLEGGSSARARGVSGVSRRGRPLRADRASWRPREYRVGKA